ncbi:hypothetical protein GGF50DRAFT_120835 [Schizophyllum commune]
MAPFFSRSRTTSQAARADTPSLVIDDAPPPPPPPDPHAFLPLHIAPPPRSSSASVSVAAFPASPSGGTITGPSTPPPQYGYLSYRPGTTLGLAQAAALADVLCAELTARGAPSTPFIFSALALDVSRVKINRLIDAFLGTCVIGIGKEKEDREKRWREEVRFGAGVHEMGFVLRWGMARVRRANGERGLLSLSYYDEWARNEEAQHYPPTHIHALLRPLPPALRSLLHALLTLLSRVVAHSAKSGHTPPSLAPLFGPLVFGLGKEGAGFSGVYERYLASTTAMEHLLLAFFRAQDAETVGGAPTRLREWIAGYPGALGRARREAPTRPGALEARKGARVVRLMSVRRNVRTYESDIVKNGSLWGYSAPNHPPTALAATREWERMTVGGREPRYSDNYKKRLDLPTGAVPATPPAAGNGVKEYGVSSYLSPTGTTSPYGDYLGGAPLSSTPSLTTSEGHDDKFKSLTDLKWGEFEALGFDEQGVQDKLKFDLGESARSARKVKRGTISWNDFSSDGFLRGDDGLDVGLRFTLDNPLGVGAAAHPLNEKEIKERHAELTKKLKKREKSLPAFGWDTAPVLGPDVLIEESFLDVYCDLLCGGWQTPSEPSVPPHPADGHPPGTPDRHRRRPSMGGLSEADLARECNWAMVEYKSLQASSSSIAGRGPSPLPTSSSNSNDPRHGSTLILFEEFVPHEYRQQLALMLGGHNQRKRLPSLFSSSPASSPSKSPSKSSPSTPVKTSNKAPFAATMPSKGRKGGGKWKQAATLNGKPYNVGDVPELQRAPSSATSQKEHEFEGMLRGDRVSETKVIRLTPVDDGERTESGEGTTEFGVARARSRGKDDAKDASRKSRFRLTTVGQPLSPAEYNPVEFETQVIEEGDDGKPSGKGKKHKDDDAWVDILIAGQDRMPGQDAEARPRAGGARANTYDPDLASREVQEVLRGVHRDSVDVDNFYGQDPHASVDDVDEIETIPHRDDRPRAQEPESQAYTDIDYAESEADRDAASLLQDEQSGYGGDDDIDDDDESIRSPALDAIQQKKRQLSYFDLHPERRPVSQDAAPRPSIESGLTDESAMLDSTVPDSDTEEGAGLRPVKAGSYVNDFDDDEPRQKTPPAQTNGAGAGAGAAKSKTASLIEMYRERERAGQASPSKIPVRGPVPLAVGTAPPMNATGLAARPDVPPLDILDPPPPLLEPGRESPGRYVHGAPLHNVLEEPEEEE